MSRVELQLRPSAVNTKPQLLDKSLSSLFSLNKQHFDFSLSPIIP